MAVPVRGINYDTGCEVVAGRLSRPVFDLNEVEGELAEIANQLHCTAVRITGNDIRRLEAAARCATEHGLEVWLSPASHDQTREGSLILLERTADLAESLRGGGHQVVLVVGWESTAFLRGMVSGRSTFDRLGTLASIPRLLASTARHGSFNARLNDYLARAIDVARGSFRGRLTYASGMWEQIDWRPFDIVGADSYRDAFNAASFSNSISTYASHGKPFAALEFGCCTHRGAAQRGSRGWMVADPMRRRVRAGVVRDELEQANYLDDLYRRLERAGAYATFPFTYASYNYPTLLDGPDLDVGAYGIVRLIETTADTSGTVEIRREPKLAYQRLQGIYSGAAGEPTRE